LRDRPLRPGGPGRRTGPTRTVKDSPWAKSAPAVVLPTALFPCCDSVRDATVRRSSALHPGVAPHCRKYADSVRQTQRLPNVRDGPHEVSRRCVSSQAGARQPPSGYRSGRNRSTNGPTRTGGREAQWPTCAIRATARHVGQATHGRGRNSPPGEAVGRDFPDTQQTTAHDPRGLCACSDRGD
jgi:hypothetical protein